MELAVGMVGNATMEKLSKGFAFLEILTSLKDSTFSRLRAVADMHHACRWRRSGSCNIIVREAEVGRNDGEIARNSGTFVARYSLSSTYMSAGDMVGAVRAVGGQVGKRKRKGGHVLCGRCANCFSVILDLVTNGTGNVSYEEQCILKGSLLYLWKSPKRQVPNTVKETRYKDLTTHYKL
jgi:hypothetical protein